MVHGVRRELARLAVGVVAFLLSTTCFGQALGTSQGLAWLQQQVAAGGTVIGEGSSIATPFQVRAEALHALSLRSTPPSSLAAVVAADSEANTEFLARRAIALKAAGQNIDGVANTLLSIQGAAGGWGLAESYVGDSLDTAHALHALIVSGRSNAPANDNAIAFLASARLPEGGWGVNTATSIYVTAQVLLAADRIDSPAADAIVVAARDWLLAQRANGHYGNTVENSLAAIALLTQTDDPALITPIMDAIRAGQGADGSWGGDPFVTALALRALIAHEASFAQLRGRVIHAITSSPIAGATVTLGTTPPLVATTDAQGLFDFASVRSGTYSISIAIPGFGTLTRTVGLAPGQSVDLGDLALLPDAAIGAVVRGTITAFGTGAAVADAVVSVTVGGNTFSTFSSVSGAFEISGLAAGTAQLRIERTGFKVLTADLFLQAGRIYTYPVRMYPASTAGGQLDLLVIDAETGAPIAGAAFTLGAPHSVNGTSDASGRMSFVGLNPGAGSFSLGAPGYVSLSGTVTIVSSSTLFGVLPLPPTVPGTSVRTLTGRVIDNVTRGGIPDVEVSPFQQSSPPYPLSTTDADGRFTVAGYRGGTLELVMSKAGYEGTRFVFDPASNPSSDLGDFPMLPENIGGVLPDLIVGDIDRSLVVEAANGALAGALVVKVKNAGVRPVNGAFTVLAFFDANANGAYDAGTDVRLAEASVTGPGNVFAANAVETVSLQLAGTLPFRDAPIHVWVDSGNIVAEANEGNNIRTSAEFCRRCPSNAVVSPPTSGGLSMESEFAGAFQPFDLGKLPSNVPRHHGFYLPKKGDMCTAYFSGSAATAGGAIYAVRLVRDPDSRIIGFDKASFVASALGHGWGAAYLGDDGRFVVNDWSGPISGGGSNGLYGFKPGDSAPGKAIRLDNAPYNIVNGSTLAIVPPGLPGAGKFKLTTQFGDWYSGQLDPSADGYFSIASLARVGTLTLGGAGVDAIRPQGLTYVQAGTPGFSRAGVIASDWANNQVVTYEVDANGDPIRSTRRVMLRALGGAAGSNLDPVTGDLLIVTDNNAASSDKVVVLRTTAKPAALADLSASHASAATDGNGHVTGITVRVGNAGPAPALATKVGFYAVRNGTRGELLGEVPVAALAANTFVDLTFPVSPPLSAPGVMAVADSREDLAECQETNNTAVVAVQALLGTVQATVDLPAYSPGASVAATATVTNPGAAVTSYGVRFSIHDATGALIEDLGVRPVDALAPGGSVSLDRTWTVPAVLSGRYSARATLLNAGGAEIGQHAADFNVNPVPAGAIATVRVTTDKGRYNTFDTVTTAVTVANEQTNTILQNLRVTRSIAPALGGTPLHSSELSLAQLAPLATADAGFAHALGGAAPGAYVIDVAVYDGAVQLARQTMPFEVESTGQTGAELQGTLTLAPADPRQLESLDLHATVTNVGNADIAALDAGITIIDPADGRVVATFAQTVAAPRNQPVHFDPVWVVPLATPAGTYAAVFSATVNGVTRSLAQRTFIVREAPVLLGATTVTTDHASYDALEALKVTAHLANDANGRPLSNLRVTQSITGPGGSLPAQEVTVAQLASGQSIDVDFIFNAARFAPGTYTVEQRVLDAAGAVLDTKQVTFTIRSTADTGVGVTGALAANPNDLTVGASTALAGTLTNAGNADATGVPVRVAIRDAAQNVVQEFNATLAVSQAQPTSFDNLWAVPLNLAAGTYTATLTATFGANTATLAQAAIAVRDLPILVTSTVSTNKATYDALETATIAAHVANGAGGRPLANLRVTQKVTGPSANVVFAGEQPIAQLVAGASFDTTFAVAIARNAPGTYSVEQKVLDTAGATLDIRQATFTVRSTVDSGIGITGTLSASPAAVTVGATTSLSATLTNAGNADAPAVPVRVAIRDAAQAVVQEFTATLAIGQSQPTLFANTWAVPSNLPAGNYVATLTAAFGPVTMTLAQATIVVNPALAQGTVTPRLIGTTRLAVLVSCAQGAANGTGTSSPDNPFCAVARRQAIDDLLTSMGIVHKVTTSAEEFRHLLRCGDYDTFWIAGGAEKMRGTLAEEVREAVLRGGALVIDGFHDNRSSVFNEVADVQVNGKLSGVAATVTLNGALGSGTQPALGALLNIDALAGSTIQGAFANGKPAIVTSAYGNGKAAFFAYDFAATLAAAPSDAVRRALLSSALGFVRPAAPSGNLLAGSTVQVEIEVHNAGAASDYRVDATSAAAPQTWNLSLAAGETRLVGFGLKLPAAAGAADVVVNLFRVEGGTATQVDSETLTLQIETGAQAKDALVADLNALTLPAGEQAFRNTAVTRINSAWTKAGQGDADGAMADYLKANDELAKIASIATIGYEIRVDRLMQDAGLRNCTAPTLACGTPNWSPAAYSVLAFGSASMSNGQASGPVGIGGSGSISAYQVASALSGDAARLNVSGSLSYSSGSVGQNGSGVIRVGGSASVTQSVGRRELLTGVATEDFAGLKAWYQAFATNIGALAGTPAVVTSGGTYTFTGTNTGLNVFTIAGGTLGSVRAMHFNVPDSASVILNVTGGAATWTNGQSFWNGQPMSGASRSARVLYNFPAAGAISVSSWTPQGTTLAPNASLSINSGSINGGLVVNTLSSSSTGFSCPGAFEGVLPSTVIPTP